MKEEEAPPGSTFDVDLSFVVPGDYNNPEAAEAEKDQADELPDNTVAHEALELPGNHRGLELRVGEIEFFFFDHFFSFLFRDHCPARMELGFVEKEYMEDVLEPVARDSDLSVGSAGVASGAGILLEILDQGIHGEGDRLAGAEAGSCRGDTDGTHLRHGGGGEFGVFSLGNEAFDGVGDRLADGSRGHSRPGRHRGDDGPVGRFARLGDRMRGGEGDPGGEDVGVFGIVIGHGPVGGFPLLVGLGAVVGIDFHETVGHEEFVGDLGSRFVVGFEADSAEGRDQHGEVEALLTGTAVDQFVFEFALFDFADVGVHLPVDPPLGEEGFTQQFGAHDVPHGPQLHSIHAEVAQVGFVGDPFDLHIVPYSGLSGFVLDVEDVFEGGSLAGTGAVAGADDDLLFFTPAGFVQDIFELLLGVDGVVGGADADGVLADLTPLAQAGSGTEVEFGTRGVDQVVIAEFFALTLLALSGVLDGDERSVALLPTFGMDGERLGLAVVDAGFGVDRCQGENDLFLGHLPDPHPDVGGDPVPQRVGGDDHHFVLAAQPLGEESGGGVPGHSSSHYYDSCHICPFARIYFHFRPFLERNPKGMKTQNLYYHDWQKNYYRKNAKKCNR